ncbi:hypothetical protein GLOIN_2v1475241 [Rhizophagus irregularis DAOM 181602=DAOM 197198]|uniref:Ion transport domain-containing protein n=1 Tax=Rhizophagus irregularis (strain DAOM 181602 / DAOM 197198 / MUCL 43194) TaxID=747089 RepID=A0A2P4QDI7_RHIID|nr:hypothetical protein GLOIN_2v1475241 [Rhizophagus irregularis DAOM 181602=DAOM 197198]POG75695.1 hypothetical protein GLOIN_2v1475241 [Rhizophagus irregularis DAOM 181602=DAOM 197198]|eukprot:XP_025182561.1 hypothetical protein GLOIN_2v1475241 [Rhizophagus irregularis DAOM 181602=DAOM 197198]
MNAKSIKSNKYKTKLSYNRDVDGSSSSDGSITNDNKYHIAICQNGKFVATFDTETLQIKLLENTDSIYEMIEQFKIGRDFTISQERQHTIIVEGKETTSTNDENFGWSIDISNLYTKDMKIYDLEKMELETDARLVENIVNQYNNYETFSVSRLQLCFTQVNIVNLFQMENGLQIASKKFNEIERIYLLEFIDGDDRLLIIGEGLKEGNDLEKELKFIVWDLYDTGKYELTELDDFLITNVENIHTRLARTSGNIIQIDNYGNVSSILKEVKKGLEKKDKKKKAEKEELNKAACPNINLKKDIGKKPNGKPDENHTIYYDKNINFKPIVNDREPWVLGNCERNSYCLYQNKLETETESLQLIVGRSTVQVWHQIQDSRKNKDDLPNKGEPFLEYIWTNRIPINQEREKTRLRVEAFNYESNEGSQIIDFYLKVYWYERNDNKAFKKNEHEIVIDEDKEIDEIEFKKKKINDSVKVKRKEKVIKRQDIIEKFHAVRHACKTLEHLNKRYKCKYLADNYGKIHKYEEMVTYIEHIIRIFAKYEPENFRLLDVRHNLMKSLILGDCDRLIKFILFGDKEGASENDIAYNELRHIPCNRIWPGKKFLKDDDLDFGEKKDYTLIDNEKIKPENNMELAIYHCKGRELKDTIVVAYFLEYYSRNATDNADPDEIIPNEHLKSRNHSIKFRAFRPMIKNLEINEINKLECYNFWIWIPFKSLKDYIFEKVENYDNVLGKSPLALRVVPLPGFTINDIPKVPKVPKEYSRKKIILNIFLFLFIPRSYKIRPNDKNRLSPFSRMVLYENNDDIYNNPAIEVIIDFYWKQAKNFMYFLFLQFFIYAICFMLVSWAYLSHSTIIDHNFLLMLIIVFYYLALCQLITEVKQFHYRGLKKYSEIYNFFDIVSIIFSITIMSLTLKHFQISDGFGSAKEVDTGLTVSISFSIFLLWVELIMYLRLISDIGIYIYYVVDLHIQCMKTQCWFVLLREPTNIKTKDSTYSGKATNSLTNETLDIELKSDFDPTSSDNPFTSFFTAIEAAYFWINGDWVQRDEFDFWVIDVYTFISSLFLVIVLQNILIAFMSGAYEKAEANGKQTLLRNRANHIADYEALYHINFRNPEPEPNYIYYFGQAKYFEEWYNTRKDDDKSAIYEDFKNVSNEFSNNIEYLIKRNEGKSSIDEFEEICEVKNTLEIEVKKFQLKLEKLRDLTES